MKIDPVKEENELLYADVPRPVEREISIDTEIYTVVTLPPSIPWGAILSVTSYLISILTMFLLLINKFKIKNKSKNGNLIDETTKEKFNKRRKRYLIIMHITTFLFLLFGCVNRISNLHLSEMILLFGFILLNIFIVLNHRKIRRGIDVEKCEKRVEIAIIIYPALFFVYLLYLIFLELSY